MKMTEIATILFLSVFAAAPLQAADDWDSSVLHEGRKREFKVHGPRSSDGARPLPLVIALHGGGGRADGMEKFTGFFKLADSQGFIAVYPQGFEKQWNDGREIKESRAHSLKIDDTGFIKKMIAAIKAKYKIDDRRIYAGGISNGGFMSMRLACELSDELAAVAVVCAGMNPDLEQHCAPSGKISVMLMNGTADPLVPYGGGVVSLGKRNRDRVLSADQTLKFWLDHNGCAGVSPSLQKIDHAPKDGTEIEKQVYSCGEAEVVLYKVIGGGHTWPGGMQYLGERIIGKTSRDINATEEIWEFFKKHSR
jgi:polyhydroxybutyrate depolymerase